MEEYTTLDPSEEEAEGTSSDPEMSESDLQAIVRAEITSAADFIDTDIAPQRAEATKYYKGEKFGNESDGRSQIVSHDVRDTVSAIMPSLLRVFYSSESIVDFIPRSQEDVPAAEQATKYVNYVLNQENDFFSQIHSVFKDALIRKVGILKYWWEEKLEVTTEHLSGLDSEAIAYLASDPQLELVEVESIEEFDGMGQAIPPSVSNVTVKRTRDTGRVRVEALPPEEFLIDRDAKTLEDATLVAHRTLLTVSDLVAQGYDEDEVLEHTQEGDPLQWSDEIAARNPSQSFGQAHRADDAMRQVMYTEAYIRVDMDGDGVAELMKVCCIGSDHHILYYMPVADVPFATFCPNPEPHSFFGLSVADSVMDLQKTKSIVLRNMLDSLAMSIHPRTAIVSGQVSLEDVLNTEVGAVIRQRQPGAVTPFVMPFVGKEAFPMVAYLDELRENRTGISKAASGLDADALQSSTATAVAATVSGAHQHIEIIARIFAETGMKRLFKGVLKLVHSHQDSEKMVRLTNQFVPVDPKSWDAQMDVSTNVALGRGTDTDRLSTLTKIIEKQETILGNLGPQNAIVSPKQYSDTLAKIVELAGFKDSSQFFSQLQEGQPAVPPEAQQNKQSPEQLLAQVQAQAIQADIQKKGAELQLKREEMIRKDDREKDKLDADITLRAAEIEGKHQTTVNVAGIRARVDMDREMIKQQQQQPIQQGPVQ